MKAKRPLGRDTACPDPRTAPLQRVSAEGIVMRAGLGGPPRTLREVWESADYLVQVYEQVDGQTRITVNRTARVHGQWAEGITWDALQEIKRQIGRGDRLAVEVYPPDPHVIDVANLRHLWLLPEGTHIGWRNVTAPPAPTPKDETP